MQIVRRWKHFWPFSKVVYKHHCILVSILGFSKLDNIHSYSIKGACNWYRCMWWSFLLSNSSSGTLHTATTPLNNVISCFWPPIVTRLAVHRLYHLVSDLQIALRGLYRIVSFFGLMVAVDPNNKVSLQ